MITRVYVVISYLTKAMNTYSCTWVLATLNLDFELDLQYFNEIKLFMASFVKLNFVS